MTYLIKVIGRVAFQAEEFADRSIKLERSSLAAVEAVDVLRSPESRHRYGSAREA